MHASSAVAGVMKACDGKHTWGSSGLSHQASATTPGRMKQHMLSTWPAQEMQPAPHLSGHQVPNYALSLFRGQDSDNAQNPQQAGSGALQHAGPQCAE